MVKKDLACSKMCGFSSISSSKVRSTKRRLQGEGEEEFCDSMLVVATVSL